MKEGEFEPWKWNNSGLTLNKVPKEKWSDSVHQGNQQ